MVFLVLAQAAVRYRPALVASGGRSRYEEALHEARMARQLLNYHAGMATGADASTLLGIRDAQMADNLSYIVQRERGKVLAFAHNSHLHRGQAVWPWYSFWPVGSQLDVLFGPRYVVIGSALAVSEENGIGTPEPGTLEARLSAAARPGGALFLPLDPARELATELEQLPARAGSTLNPGYLPLNPQRLRRDFDAIAFVESTPYSRGAPPLPQAPAADEDG
jgi:erythromycin esterase-like protein